jgi:hypothetical protein
MQSLFPFGPHVFGLPLKPVFDLLLFVGLLSHQPIFEFVVDAGCMDELLFDTTDEMFGNETARTENSFGPSHEAFE